MENKSGKRQFDYNYLSVGLIYIWSFAFLLATPQIKDPGSRMFPVAVSIFSIILATVLLVRTKFSKNKKEELDFKGAGLAMTMALFLTLYVAAIEIVGFYIATPVYLYLTMNKLGQKNKKTMAIASILTPIIILIFFDIILGMEIPQGLIYEVLFG